MIKRFMPLLMLLMLGGCTYPAVKQSAVPDAIPSDNPTVEEMLGCLAANDHLSAQQLRHKQQALEKQPARALRSRFERACLLGRSNASDAELVQAQQILETLEQEQRLDIQHKQLIGLYTEHLRLVQRLRQQQRETREYKTKIELLKGLEEELEPGAVKQEQTP
ncbi:hypothetical protein ADIMK_2549 [Marinobacterium lacunae]|uniref:Lipoprotein n=1 Tax=Marinobacterium lacunae TaxID=1232683 RepID=A0A081FWX0_9GAMM|nr:hypothetical protein [Marinobacterium lacunae]KEA63025.1 hypothetical protein ADIMK_2549 [Marinobacterium lacunae]